MRNNLKIIFMQIQVIVPIFFLEIDFFVEKMKYQWNQLTCADHIVISFGFEQSRHGLAGRKFSSQWRLCMLWILVCIPLKGHHVECETCKDGHKTCRDRIYWPSALFYAQLVGMAGTLKLIKGSIKQFTISKID